jgi:hypothetical protein
MTEIYVSVDSLEYRRLDLYRDESILMKSTAKDLQDISKIFSPYSQDFTFKATPKNIAALGFFGNTDVIKVNPDNKFSAKVYTEGQLNLVGSLQVTAIKYKLGKPTDFTANFATTMTNLKTLIGDDLIVDLADEQLLVDWLPKSVYQLMNSGQNTTIDGVPIHYFVPLISNNRVLAYDQNRDGNDALDNVSFLSTADPRSSDVINSSELRPCISFSTIIELIKKKYNLEVIAPLDERSEYKDLVIYCNSEKINNNESSLIVIKNDFNPLAFFRDKNESKIPDPKKYVATTDTLNDTITITKRNPPQQRDGNYDDFFKYIVRLNGIITSEDKFEATIKLKRKSDDSLIISKTFNSEDADNEATNVIGNPLSDAREFTIEVSDVFFVNDEIEFYAEISFEQVITWADMHIYIRFTFDDNNTGFFNREDRATYSYESLSNANSESGNSSSIDIIKSLPELKVFDFLNSYFKMFNISVFDTSPNDNILHWLTPEDINSTKQVYSKRTLDYTRYLDNSSKTKEVPSDNNVYNFKHQDSKYRSAVDFKTAAGIEYGQVKFPDTPPDEPKTFTVETNFSLIPPVNLVGTNITTFYGFDDSDGEPIETGETRYEPNYDELTIFYFHGIKSLGRSLGVQNEHATFGLIVSELITHLEIQPFSKDGDSLGFSVLVENSVSYPNNLFSNGYINQITRLLDPNVLTQKFNLTLPASEIYLNESTTDQGDGQTPTGFRLQNDIIIQEDKFSIVDSTIDQTTGKTKLTLLNY